MSITLVAGLGNPGREYENTRHNLGFALVDALASRQQLPWKTHPAFEAEVARWDRRPEQTILLLKPQTFMNESGRAISAFMRYYKVPLERVIAVYDDLTLEVGAAKVSLNGSAGGHNGVASILERVGNGFIRYRLGIGPKFPKEMDLKDFVLGRFSPEHQSLVSARLDHHLNGLLLLLDSGVERAMNSINRKALS